MIWLTNHPQRSASAHGNPQPVVRPIADIVLSAAHGAIFRQWRREIVPIGVCFCIQSIWKNGILAFFRKMSMQSAQQANKSRDEKRPLPQCFPLLINEALNIEIVEYHTDWLFSFLKENPLRNFTELRGTCKLLNSSRYADVALQ